MKKVLFVVSVAVLALGTASAYAKIATNGENLNGVHLNGVRLNGTVLKGASAAGAVNRIALHRAR